MLLPAVHHVSVSVSVSWLGLRNLLYFYSVTHFPFSLLTRAVSISTILLIYPLRFPFYTRVITPHYF